MTAESTVWHFLIQSVSVPTSVVGRSMMMKVIMVMVMLKEGRGRRRRCSSRSIDAFN